MLYSVKGVEDHKGATMRVNQHYQFNFEFPRRQSSECVCVGGTNPLNKAEKLKEKKGDRITPAWLFPDPPACDQATTSCSYHCLALSITQTVFPQTVSQNKHLPQSVSSQALYHTEEKISNTFTKPRTAVQVIVMLVKTFLNVLSSHMFSIQWWLHWCIQ